VRYTTKLLSLIGLMAMMHQLAYGQQLNDVLMGKSNLNEIRTLADQYFAEKGNGLDPKLKFEDNEYVKYRRIEHYLKHRVMPDGSFPDMTKQYEIYKSLQQTGMAKKTRAGNWRSISQTTSTSGYEGMGRLAAVAFHPTDTNIIYVGANKGGIWRTTTGGNNWTPLGDQLPYCSVGNIVVDKVNPSILYITVGLNEGWWHFGLGVYKSTNAGQTWTATPQSGYYTQEIVYYKLIAHPDSNNVLYSGQSDGLWKTSDAGATWTKIRNGLCRDIEFKPFNPATMYIAGSNELYRSTNRGQTWVSKTSFGTGTDIELSVTPADSNYIGFVTNLDDFYLSTDGANTAFVLRNNAVDDNAIVQFSHLNKNRVYCGYVTNYRSTNGGVSWSQITNWYNDGILPAVHADNHYADVNPLKPHYIYICNDGGLYRYNELTDVWTDLSNGLIITEFYKIAHSSQDSVFIIGGTQDNGGRKRISSTSWDATNGGDGMEVAVNPLNDQTMYTTYWGGDLYRSYDQWVNDTYYDISADSNKGAWVTPYLIDPNDDKTLVAGYADVWRSTNEGDTWTRISDTITGNYNTKLEILDVAPSNTNVIYAGYNEKLYVTTNLGASWSTKQIPDSTGVFEDASMVKVHPKQSNVIYVTKVGYGENSKVYKSMNNGTTWTNISYNIPNIPVNCIQIDHESDSLNMDIYIGTDVGVFYKKDSDVVWQYYGTGMPNTQVSDLEIFYPTGKLRAGTYGRGIWENDIVRHIAPLSVPQPLVSKDVVKLIENPVQQFLKFELNFEQQSALVWTIYDEQGRKLSVKQYNAAQGVSNFSLDVADLPVGIYMVDVVSEKGFKSTSKFLKR